MKTIKLYGHLGKQFGKIHKYAVDTPQEAIRLLCANYKGFEQAVLSFKGIGYKVILGKDSIVADDLSMITGQDIIKIVPIISGRGDSTLNTIIVGIILVVTGTWWAEGLAAAGTTSGASFWAASTMSTMGTALIFSGIASALYSPPSIDSTQAKLSSEGSFDGATNTTRQGLPVPLGYGKLMVGSAVISAGMFSEAIPV